MLGFYQELIDSNKLKVINTFYEQGAGFARGSARYLFDYFKKPQEKRYKLELILILVHRNDLCLAVII
jgi:hypothetical protein